MENEPNNGPTDYRDYSVLTMKRKRSGTSLKNHETTLKAEITQTLHDIPMI